MESNNCNSNRFTIVNNDISHIHLSNSLLSKLGNAPNNDPQSVSSASERIAPSTNAITAESSANEKAHDLKVSENDNIRYAEALTANEDCLQLPEHQGFALRDKYEQKLKLYQKEWNDRLQKLESLNDRLMMQKSVKFSNDVKKLESKFRKHSTFVENMPCLAAESDLRQCYSANPKKPLMCADQVKAFSDCVRKAQLEAFKIG